MKRLKTMASVQLSNVDKHSEEGQIAVKLCNYVDVYYNDLITTESRFHERDRHTRAGAAIPASRRRRVDHQGFGILD